MKRSALMLALAGMLPLGAADVQKARAADPPNLLFTCKVSFLNPLKATASCRDQENGSRFFVITATWPTRSAISSPFNEVETTRYFKDFWILVPPIVSTLRCP